jgi:hypothetical protein
VTAYFAILEKKYKPSLRIYRTSASTEHMEDNSASGNPTHPVTEMAEKTSENSERTRHLPSAPVPVFHRFSELPKEIRIMIYDFAFSADWGIKLVGGIGLESEYPLPVSLRSATTVYRNIRERSRITTGLLRVNRQMYHEAVEQLYRSGNTMIIPFNHLDALLKFARKPTGFRPHQFLRPPSFPFLERACIHSRELDTRSWYTAYDRERASLSTPWDNWEIATTMMKLRRAGGIHIKHLVLSVGHGQLEKWRDIPKWIHQSGITGVESFTIKAWQFQRCKAISSANRYRNTCSWRDLIGLKVWMKSRECRRLVEDFGLIFAPTIKVWITEKCIRYMEIQWSSKVSAGGSNGENAHGTAEDIDKIPTMQKLESQEFQPHTLTLRNIFPHATIQVIEGQDVVLEVSSQGWDYTEKATDERREWLKRAEEARNAEWV